MHTENTADYIIAGQGLAGSCLAIQLIQKKKKVLVIDLPHENHCSAVAAGLFNPFTGKVMAKTWMADILFPYLFEFYKATEKLIGRNFFYPCELYRPFVSIQEQNGWMGKSTSPGFADYISKIYTQSSDVGAHDPFGGLLLKKSGYVDVPVFIDGVREFLKQSNSWRAEKIQYQELEIHDDYVVYGNVRASGVVFCEGMSVSDNPWFSWLPINPLKGETITVSMEPVNQILNRGVYVVPAAGKNGKYTVGATYDFTSSLPGITPGGRQELEAKLGELIIRPYEVIGQNWGIRPTTLDQKLMAGAHPRWRNILILNGLGTKGVSQAPYFSEQLAGWMLGENEILKEVNIQRYKALYWKSESSL